MPPETDAARGWWLRLQPRTAEKLETLWRDRPRTVAWFGNRSARELLAGRRRLRTRLSVVNTGVDWLSVRAEWEAEGLALTEADLAQLRTSNEPFVRLSGGWVRRDEAGAHDALAEALADLGLEADGLEQRLPLWQLAHANDASFSALADAGADGGTLATLARIRESLAGFSGIPRVSLPSGLTATLRPYQRDGLDFLTWTSTLGLGAVLADDMGLGKTVQALAWMQRLRELDPSGGPALVVCPASVAHNWAREAARFTPWLQSARPRQRPRAPAAVAPGGRVRPRHHQLCAAAPRHRALARDRTARGWCSTRRRTSRIPTPRSRARRASCARVIASRSPARRSRTARSTSGASLRS